jgi:uncharacterized membrane protein YdjX (TVP38/TMEM64 family)
MGLRPAQVAEGVQSAGSLRQVIDDRQRRDRTLALFDLTAPTTQPEDSLQDTVQDVVDPEEPISFGADVDRLLPVPDGVAEGTPLRIWISPAVAILGAAIVAWGSFRSVDGSVLLTLQAVIEAARNTSPANAWMMIAFLVAGLALVPLELVLVVTGLLFGAGHGALIAAGGSLALAIAGYMGGRLLGPVAVGRWVSRKSFRSIRQVGASGVGGVAMLRLAGVASAGAVHLLCGAGRVPFGAYLAGTAIGLVPAIVALSGLGALLGNTVIAPTVANAVTTVLAALGVFGCALALRAFLLVRHFAPAMSRHRARAEFG